MPCCVGAIPFFSSRERSNSMLQSFLPFLSLRISSPIHPLYSWIRNARPISSTPVPVQLAERLLFEQALLAALPRSHLFSRSPGAFRRQSGSRKQKPKDVYTRCQSEQKKVNRALAARAGEIALWVKCLLCKCRCLSSDPSHAGKHLGVALHMCNHGAGRQRRKDPGAHWSV